MKIFGFAWVFVLVVLMTTAAAEDYRIGSGDVLEISVWGVPEMSRTVIVRPDGKITLPAVGDVVADGIAPMALSRHIAKVIEDYVKQPVVTVSVQQIRNNRVYVIGGSVSRVFDMTNQMTLLKLLSELGDFSRADLRRAYLSRNNEKINTDFFALYFRGDLSQDVAIQAEDIIYIPSNMTNIVYVLGAVTTPQPIQYVEGMRALDAILGAGGFSDFARENSVSIIREGGERINIDLRKVRRGRDIEENVQLRPGDYLIVDESLF
ncbi:MAG: polysaccharide biosynthesis/export family protein [Desulfuromonadales bacterium]|nr:polysaccharide biosynthesis/export family protein [Desulfuromonadales bacterium]